MPAMLKVPTPALVREYIHEFETDHVTASTDAALGKLFGLFPGNRDYVSVLLKVTTLNTLYSTNIYAVHAVSSHICEIDTDAKLAMGNPQLVNELALVTIGGRPHRFYAFASKYCSWRVPGEYPIYDSYVDALLWAYRQQGPFAPFHRQDMWNDYSQFKGIVEAFRTCYGLSEFGFKQLDKFLWRYGAEYETLRRSER